MQLLLMLTGLELARTELRATIYRIWPSDVTPSQYGASRLFAMICAATPRRHIRVCCQLPSQLQGPHQTFSLRWRINRQFQWNQVF